MRPRASWLLSVTLIFFAVRALGDGGIVPATAFAIAKIPDQRALINYAKGEETLVIDTSFRGDGTNFAWLIPTPALPSIEPATSGLFTTLQFLFRPRVSNNVFPLFPFVFAAGFCVAGIAWRQRYGGSMLPMLLMLPVLFLLASLLLPSLAGSNGIYAIGTPVAVIDRQRIDGYDTAILKSTNGSALFEWFKANGFSARPDFAPALNTYAREGWYFVAANLRLSNPGELAAPHPLIIRFKTDRAVYPLRLTGVDNERCSIELYVFGPDRAEANGFTVERCTHAFFPSPNAPSHYMAEEIRIRHPSLRNLVSRNSVATKLVGALTDREMQSDCYITWVPMREERTTLYGQDAAIVFATNVASPVLVIGFLGLLLSGWAAEKNASEWNWTSRISGSLCLASLVVWGISYALLPKTPVFRSRLPTLQVRLLHQEACSLLTSAAEREVRHESGRFAPNAGWIRQELSETGEIRRAMAIYGQTNPFAKGPWHEEDSPGNYTLREKPGGIDYIWYDAEGGENVVPLFPAANRR